MYPGQRLFGCEKNVKRISNICVTSAEFPVIFKKSWTGSLTKYKETKEYVEVFLPEKDVIYIRAQTVSDTWRTNYDGSHCSQYYKLIGFRIAPRNEI